MNTKPQLQPSLFTGLSLSIIPVLVSGYVFGNCLAFKDSDQHWRYICSLIGFSIFALMFLCVLAVAVYYIRLLKREAKK